MSELNICRICEKSTNLINISLPHNSNYVVKFLECANVSYKFNDGLPPYLCRVCTTQLNYAYTFKRKCEETKIKLKRTVSCKAIKIKDEFQEDVKKEEFTKFNDNPLNPDEIFLASKKCSAIVSPTKEKLRCDLCKKGFLVLNTLEKHMRKKHGMKSNHRQCPKCFKWLKSYRFYIRHMKEARHTKDQIEKCKYCDKTFAYRNISRHVKAVHFELRPFICDICNNSYSQKIILKSHIISAHMNEYNYSCSVCGKKFKLKMILQNHKNTHLSKDEKRIKRGKSKIFLCQFCSRIFESKHKLLVHERVKHSYEMCTSENVPKISCAICKFCGKILVSKAYLQIHERVHTGERPYKCETCSNSFKSQTSLNKHILTHTNLKPHTCSLCNRSFSRLANLQTHIFVHTGEKPHKCNYCMKSFAQKGSLSAHIRTHTGEKPYKCEHCSKCFSDCSTWIRHKRVHIK